MSVLDIARKAKMQAVKEIEDSIEWTTLELNKTLRRSRRISYAELY